MPDKSDKYPWMQFYVADWLRDTAPCAPATRGVWIDALCAMHARNRCGHLRGTYDQLARELHCSRLEVEFAVAELESMDIADVKLETDAAGNVIVTLINRRMKREFNERESIRLRVNNHRRNGDSNANVTPTVTPVRESSNSDVTAYNQNQNQNQRGEREKSESNPPHSFGSEKPLSASERITREKELVRVEQALSNLKSWVDGGNKLTDAERAKRASLKERRIEILEILGMKA